MAVTFKSEQRLKKSSDFSLVQETGHKVYSKHFVFIILKTSSPNSRLGVTVTKKIDKRATERNRLKRLMREVFRLESRLIASPMDLVMIARHGATESDFFLVKKEFLGTLRYHGYLLGSKRQVDESK